MNCFKDRPDLMTRMSRELQQHPDCDPYDKDGNPVKNSQGFLVSDQSNPDVRQVVVENSAWMLYQQLMEMVAYCDSSQHTDSSFPNVSVTKMQEWSKGLLTLTHDVHQKLGDDGATDRHRFLISRTTKAVQIEF